MLVKDYYKILNLEGPKVTEDQIKIAFREQAKKNHPDVNTGDKVAEEKFKNINEAYKTLSEKKSKKKYDKLWNKKINKKQKNSIIESTKKISKIIVQNIKDVLSGRIIYRNIPMRGKDIETSLDLSIMEAFYGQNRKLRFKRHKW